MRVVPPLTGHLDMALSNFVKGYRQNGLVGDILFPRLPVLRQTDRFWVFDRANQTMDAQTLRAFGTSPQETRFTLSTATYNCKSHALKATIPDEDRDNYTVGDLNSDTAQMLMDKILLDAELARMTLATTAGNYASGNTEALSSTSLWDAYSTSTPLSDVEDAKARIRLTGSSANTLVLADDVFTSLRNHPTLVERFKYTTVTGGLDTTQMATAFGVDKVVVASGVQVIAGVPSFIWSNVAILAYVSPSVGNAGVLSGTGSEGSIGPKQLSFGKSFTWTNAPQTIGGYGTMISRAADATAKSDVVGVDWYRDDQITGSDCGFLFSNVLGTP